MNINKQMKYSAKENGFYAMDSKSPDDCVVITSEMHAELLLMQSAGKQIIPDSKGYPVAVDMQFSSNNEVANAARTERDSRLTACDWTVLPDSQLTDQQRADWMEYRQKLRDITEQSGFPTDILWPDPPASTSRV